MSETAAVEAPVTPAASEDAPEAVEAPEQQQATAPAAPQGAPEGKSVPSQAAAVEAPAEEDPDRHLTHKERQRQKARAAAEEARERSRGKLPEDRSSTKPEGDDGGRPRDEQGRFVAKGEGAQGEAPSATDPDGTAGAAPDGAPSRVQIELPEGHWMRKRGVTHIEAPAEQERTYRGLVNESTELRSAVAAREEQIVRLQARLEAIQQRGNEPDPLETPVMKHLMKEIERKYPGQAELMKDALRAKIEQDRGGVDQDAEAKVHVFRAARQFRESVVEEAPARYPLWEAQGELAPRMDKAFATYGKWLDQENRRRFESQEQPFRPTAGHFFKWIDDAYRSDPRVQAQMRQAMEKRRADIETAAERKAREKLEAEERERLTAAGRRHGTRPPAVPVTGPRGARADVGEEEVDPKTMSRDERRKHFRRIAQQLRHG